jgi:hypothetical protein
MEPIIEELRAVAQAQGLASIECAEFADYMDSVDPYRSVKDEFHFPPGKTRESKLYLCGNSLGLQPRSKFESLVVSVMYSSDCFLVFGAHRSEREACEVLGQMGE